ncbi:hypothetical protein NZK35_23290 [Stieleria sp. ICT_E10.1]|uniref:hypothetical protein n=1 Tax=Stieleria sedimenti TaxID=2976331 RepID=UPI00217F8CB8|nr:hypothetical protein [Stieleria sedimenti]MCS7469587.1 hypothetical protein [Stieleria sedimenti]
MLIEFQNVFKIYGEADAEVRALDGINLEINEGDFVALKLLISPSGEVFPRITRDANRTREEPTLPEKWRLIGHTLDRPMEFKLTGETTVIRTGNQDSFQGPVKFSLNESQPEQSAQSRGGGRTTEATTAISAEPSYGTRNDKHWTRCSPTLFFSA